MIISRLVSGLGNQLFQYVIGRQLAIKHKVPLKLDTSFFETQTLRSFSLNNYNINAQLASKKEVDGILHWQNHPALPEKIYRTIQRSLPRTMQRYFKEKEWWSYDKDLLNVSSKVYLDGYWQHYKYFLNVPSLIFDELTLTTNIPEAQQIAKNILSNSSAISIHVRRGDYTTDTLMGVLPLEYYTSAIDYMNEKVTGPHYYIFSDDITWTKEHLKINSPVTYVEVGADYVELDLMSKCHHNIIANSSFSWWGAYLNRNPGKLVIAPAQWVKQPEVNARIKLQFPGWIKM